MERRDSLRAGRSRVASAWILLAILSSYLALGCLLGFIQGGLAPVLRSLGMSLENLRWVYLLFVPFGVAFLWAPMVDRCRWPWFGRRTGWIVPMQVLACLGLVVAGAHPPGTTAWPVLIACGLLVTSAAATLDLALDALSVELVAPEWRSMATAAKMGGISFGMVLGGGVLVGLYDDLGWAGCIRAVALLQLGGIPVTLMLARLDRAKGIVSGHKLPRLRRVLRQPVMRYRLIRLSLLVCSLLALFNFNRLMLVDMGVGLHRIGWVLGIVAPLANAAACLLIVPLTRWRGLKTAGLLASLGTVLAGLTVLAGYWVALPAVVMAGAIGTTAMAAALYVVLGSLILAWSVGPQPATDYALLYGLGRLIATIAVVALPSVISQIGWLAFQAVIVLCFVLALRGFLPLFTIPGGDARASRPLS